MANAVKDLLKHAFENGYTVAVPDPDEMYDTVSEMPMFDGPDKAWDEINAYDGGAEFFLVKEGENPHWVMPAIGYGNSPEEYVADYGVCPFTEAWFNKFYKDNL